MSKESYRKMISNPSLALETENIVTRRKAKSSRKHYKDKEDSLLPNINTEEREASKSVEINQHRKVYKSVKKSVDC